MQIPLDGNAYYDGPKPITHLLTWLTGNWEDKSLNWPPPCSTTLHLLLSDKTILQLIVE